MIDRSQDVVVVHVGVLALSATRIPCGRIRILGFPRIQRPLSVCSGKFVPAPRGKNNMQREGNLQRYRFTRVLFPDATNQFPREFLRWLGVLSRLPHFLGSEEPQGKAVPVRTWAAASPLACVLGPPALRPPT